MNIYDEHIYAHIHEYIFILCDICVCVCMCARTHTYRHTHRGFIRMVYRLCVIQLVQQCLSTNQRPKNPAVSCSVCGAECLSRSSVLYWEFQRSRI